jgi:hypothetical protein
MENLAFIHIQGFFEYMYKVRHSIPTISIYKNLFQIVNIFDPIYTKRVVYCSQILTNTTNKWKWMLMWCPIHNWHITLVLITLMDG